MLDVLVYTLLLLTRSSFPLGDTLIVRWQAGFLPHPAVYQIMLRMMNNMRRSVVQGTFCGCLEDYIKTKVISVHPSRCKKTSASAEGVP